jgi:hypothetical protein
VAIGEHFLAAGHGERTRAQVLSRAADLILGRSGDRVTPSRPQADGPQVLTAWSQPGQCP